MVGKDSYRAITQALAALPPVRLPQPERAEVLAIVGQPAAAAEAARAVLATWRLDTDALAVAGPNTAGISTGCRLASPADAGRWALRLHTGDTPGIVVVEADLDAQTVRWARSIITAVGATWTWAVVDATRKTADCARWLEALGRVDALAVHGTGGTGDPASVLALDLPVAMVDGQPASPHTWAALLCQRLTESADAYR